MASCITASPSLLNIAASGLRLKRSGVAKSCPIIGLPMIRNKNVVRCSAEKRAVGGHESGVTMGGASLLAAAVTISSPAMALVDERMSTEGVGLPFGLSNNLLGWILFGVFGLIWALYFSYTSGLEEDEDSGLSLMRIEIVCS